MGTDEEGRALSTASYWDARYESSNGTNPTHEWFRSFQALRPFFEKHLFVRSRGSRILHLGSGDSTIPYDLLREGYERQVCVDFSRVVVEVMRAKGVGVGGKGGVEWLEGDVRDLRGVVEERSVDVAFDKGTMDAMIHGSPWSPPEEVRENTGRYVWEVHRVLKDDGVFLYVTYRQPHFIRPLLDLDGLWDLEMEVLSGGESSFDYYGWILRKKR